MQHLQEELLILVSPCQSNIIMINSEGLIMLVRFHDLDRWLFEGVTCSVPLDCSSILVAAFFTVQRKTPYSWYRG
jgi:hypothetical protein